MTTTTTTTTTKTTTTMTTTTRGDGREGKKKGEGGERGEEGEGKLLRDGTGRVEASKALQEVLADLKTKTLACDG